MFGKIKEQEVVIVFDIGSASVGGALVLLSKNRKPKIIYSERKLMALQENLDTKEFISSMSRVLNSLALDISKDGVTHLNFLKLKDKRIRKAFCFFSSPWHASQTKIVKINKDKSFCITEELMEEIIKKEEEEFIKSDLNKYSKIFGNEEKIEIMDRKIIQTKLNGYIVNNPFKKKINTAEFFIFMGFISKKIVNEISQIISKNFHLNELYTHSFTLPAFLTLRDMFEAEDNFILVDMNGEITDVSFIKDDVLLETQSFPIGNNSFLRLIMKNFGLNHKTSLSFLKNYVDGNMDSKTLLKMENIFKDIKKKWLIHLEDSIRDLSQGSILPRTIFIMSVDIGKLIRKIVKEEKFTKLVFPGYDKSSNPILIPDKINDICYFSADIERDVFICIEASFLNRVFTKPLE